MIAQVWLPVYRAARTRLVSAPKWRWVTGDRLGRAAMLILPLYLIPALLAVLIVGGIAILLLAIASPFSGSAQGAGPMAGARPCLPSRFKAVALRRPPRSRWAGACAMLSFNGEKLAVNPANHGDGW